MSDNLDMREKKDAREDVLFIDRTRGAGTEITPEKPVRPLLKKGDWIAYTDPKGSDFHGEVREDQTPGKNTILVTFYNQVIEIAMTDVVWDYDK